MAANRGKGIADEVLDQLLKGQDPATVFETEFRRAVEAPGGADCSTPRWTSSGRGGGGRSGQSPNGYGSKTVLTDTGKLELTIPRDRHGRFDPVLIGKYRPRLAGFDDKIIAL